MTPQALAEYLEVIIRNNIKLSVMIWGPPGVGKSSIVAQTAQRHEMECIDLRLSQLAPTDLRGLPVAEGGVSKWYPPEFLPREGQGILFLDEINMAPPAMQGVAQQLILDRKVGSYCVPEGWFVWAAGNRKEDHAAVYEMPAPLANRFVHVSVAPDFASFKAYALGMNIHEHILAFLTFRPELLHKHNAQQPAWPSPRSWMMASALRHAGLDVAPAIGEGASAEFTTYCQVYTRLPDIERILRGEGAQVAFPKEPSVRYATITGLAIRSTDAKQGYQAFRWLVERAESEWSQFFVTDFVRVARARNQFGELVALATRDKRLGEYLKEYLDLLAG